MATVGGATSIAGAAIGAVSKGQKHKEQEGSTPKQVDKGSSGC